MGRYTDAERDAIMKEARELLEQLDDERGHMQPAEDAIEAAPAEMKSGDDLYRYGLRLSDPHGLERWRAEAKETKRKQEQAHAEMKARETEVIRQRQQAAKRAAEHALPPVWRDAIAQFVVEFVAEKVGELRAEFHVAKANESGKVLDLPNPLAVRRRLDVA
jgi:hypothetical protein